MHRADGRKVLATASPAVSFEGLAGKRARLLRMVPLLLRPAIYADYLPKALADGSYVPAPDPLIAGTGLESVQTGFDAQIRGVSARKVVITLRERPSRSRADRQDARNGHSGVRQLRARNVCLFHSSPPRLCTVVIP